MSTKSAWPGSAGVAVLGMGLLTSMASVVTATGCGASVDHVERVSKVQQSLTDTSTPVGTWYLNANGFRLEVAIQAAGAGFTGTLTEEGGGSSALSNIGWDPVNRWLEFRRSGAGFFQWYRLSLVQGTVAGRFSHSSSSAKPALNAFSFHATGWSPTYLDTATSPRTWNLTLNGRYKTVVRIDRDSGGVLRGTMKVFDDASVAGVQEELEYQLTGITWNGTNLSFTRAGAGFTQVFTGVANGRFISGTFTHNGAGAFSWAGARGEVLGFGLGSRLPQRVAWQEATRARLANLTEGLRLVGSAEPTPSVIELPCVGCPFTGGALPPERDDNPNAWPPNYTLKKLRFSVAPGNRFDGAAPAPTRSFDAYLATPDGAPPAGGWRAVVAVNGHGGNAQQLMTKSNAPFWHGESAARRLLVVLALDIGHRPEWNAGPVVHPAIIGNGYASSDWEEDGERAFNVRRGIDYLRSLPAVRTDRIFVAGLSMGGEVTTIASAMDPRVAFAMPAGYSPDMNVMDNYGNHPCYRWNRADIHEYVDISDYQALIAPRPLVVETGLMDATFSALSAPFASDKQVTRRARLAYGPDASKLIHYLHYDAHNFHVGDFNPVNTGRPRGVRAASIIEPGGPSDLNWQTSSTTFQRSLSLYHLMNELVP
jgi:hypothetical protein